MTKNNCYFTLHRLWNIDVHNAENSISGPLDFKISWGGMPPDPPRGSRLRHPYLITPLNKYSCQYEHPFKNISYAPGMLNLFSINPGLTVVNNTLNIFHVFLGGHWNLWAVICLVFLSMEKLPDTWTNIDFGFNLHSKCVTLKIRKKGEKMKLSRWLMNYCPFHNSVEHTFKYRNKIAEYVLLFLVVSFDMHVMGFCKYKTC